MTNHYKDRIIGSGGAEGSRVRGNNVSPLIDPDKSAEEKALPRCDYRDFSQEPPYDSVARFGYHATINQSDPNRLPAKLATMLMDRDISDIITWLPHGRSFAILHRKRFASEVLPKYYDHSNVESFLRLLNAWGFRRIADGLDQGSYYHELFLRGMPHLHVRMKRSKANGKKAHNSEIYPNFYDMPSLPEQDESPRKESSSKDIKCNDQKGSTHDRTTLATSEKPKSTTTEKESMETDAKISSSETSPEENRPKHNQNDTAGSELPTEGSSEEKEKSPKTATIIPQLSALHPGPFGSWYLNAPQNGISQVVLPQTLNLPQHTDFINGNCCPMNQIFSLTVPQSINAGPQTQNQFLPPVLSNHFAVNSGYQPQPSTEQSLVQSQILQVANQHVLGYPLHPPQFGFPPLHAMLSQQLQLPNIPPSPQVTSLMSTVSQLLQTPSQPTLASQITQNNQGNGASRGGTQLIDNIITQLLQFQAGAPVQTDDQGHLRMEAALGLLRSAAAKKDDESK